MKNNYSILFSKGFENNLRVTNLLHFHKISYSNLFKKNSIFSLNSFFKFMFPIYSKNKNLIVKYISYLVKKPELSFLNCKKNSISYCYKIYIILSFLNNNIIIKKKKYFFCDLPAMTENCSFLINGIERVLVSKISRSPGAFFIKKKKMKEVIIVPIFGGSLKIFMSYDGKISFIFKNKTYPINILIKSYNIKYSEIFNKKNTYSSISIMKKKFFINYIDKEDTLLEIKKKEVLNMKLFRNYYKYKKNDYVTDKLINLFKKKNKKIKVMNIVFYKKPYKCNKNKNFEDLENENKFNFSKIGRKIINEKILLLNNKKLFLDRNTIYTILKRILDESFFLVNEIDDIKNKKIMCCGENIIRSIINGMQQSIRLIKEKLKFIKKKSFFINFNSINNSIKDFFCSSNLSQFLEQTNILSEITHKRRIYFMSNSMKNIPKVIRNVNNSFYGKICPIETPEGANIGLVNSLTIFCRIDKLGFFLSPYIKKRSKKIVYLYPHEEENIIFSNLKKYKFNNINYSFAKINNLYYITLSKYIKYFDFSSIQPISVASSTIPFLENNDANRALMGANMQRQAIPCLKPSYPYIITGIERSIFYNIKPLIKLSGIVIYKDFKNLVIESKNKIKIIEIVKNFRTNQNTIIRKKCIAKVGKKIKNNRVFKYLCNKNNILSLGRNLIAAFIPWKGYNYEDSIVISERVVRKDYFTSIHSEKYEVLLKENNLNCGKATRNIPNISKKKKRNLYKNGIVKIGTIVREGNILVGRVILDKNKNFSPEEKLINAIKKNKTPNIIDYSFRVPKGIKGVVSEIYLSKRNNNIKKIKKIKKKEILKTIKKINSKKKFESLKNVKKIIIIISFKKKLSVGDKMSGRYGNKGVIAKIVPEQDMPFMSDGQICDIILNPLSIPSRMNIGQLIELKYGFLIICIKKYIKFYSKNKKKIRLLINCIYNKKTNINIKKYYKKINICSIPFRKKNNNKFNKIIKFIISDKIFKNFNLKKDKLKIRNGLSGYEFINYISVGTIYYLKLYHTVDSKIHARSTGPYSLITQQPLKGKSQFGGQRLGEMEVWALEAYGASHILFEMLTLKSDDVIGRKIMYKNIIKNQNKTIFKNSESFNILIREIRSLGIDVKIK
ncbi:DNA-directed RNA polymerase subunit beta [Candidatus Vidania fulgoroideae]|uniref:DNA-directed RNA polymerase n=1 Tax=Candidatus Vidania fulgoroideorum TaxID=881286 RepID=A0AAX3N9L5_9PROT|nr:DNA-directed RNA polymerase subunit beta [Candidatus Vidania fulgoroideae]